MFPEAAQVYQLLSWRAGPYLRLTQFLLKLVNSYYRIFEFEGVINNKMLVLTFSKASYESNSVVI